MSNSKLFLIVVLVASAFGMWYWGRQSAKPDAPEKRPLPAGAGERTGADPFPAEPKK